MDITDEQLVTKFARLLGNKKPDMRLMSSSSAKSMSTLTSRELLGCLSKTITHEAVVCTIPSLDARKIGDEVSGSGGGESILPKLGEHHQPPPKMMDTTPAETGSVFENAVSALRAKSGQATTGTVAAVSSKSTAAPAIKSTLPPKQPVATETTAASSAAPTKAAAKPAAADKDGKIPKMEASFIKTAASASKRAAEVEQTAAQNLGTLTSWTKSSLVYASDAIANNVSESFSYLIDSRVQTWTVLLLRHSVSSGDATSRSNLLNMLLSTIKLESTLTNFKALPLPASAKDQPKETDVILPLLLEVKINVTIQENSEVIVLRAPGTIAANTNRNQGATTLGLTKVDIRLDTGELLRSMIQQARLIVLKAVEKARAASDSPAARSNTDDFAAKSRKAFGGGSKPTSNLSTGFSSALNLSTAGSSIPSGPHEPNHRLAKARPSALRLNTALQQSGPGVSSVAAGNVIGAGGANAPSDAALEKIRKSRSIQWEHGIIPKIKGPGLPTAKRQRVAQTSARLTSYKSFGRPHAGDFGSGPRNATFGDFGSQKPIWGRDGRLMNHPKPMQVKDHPEGDWNASVRKNATFDNNNKKASRASIHLMQSSGQQRRTTTSFASSSVSSAMTLSSSNSMASTASSSIGGTIPSSLQRTPTALEGFILKGISEKGL